MTVCVTISNTLMDDPLLKYLQLMRLNTLGQIEENASTNVQSTVYLLPR